MTPKSIYELAIITEIDCEILGRINAFSRLHMA